MRHYHFPRLGLAVLLLASALLAHAAAAQHPTPGDARPQTAQPPEPSVVGGVPLADGEFPWLVALYDATRTPAEGQFCGGALIAPEWVLTAAHCVVDGAVIPPSSIKALLGRAALDGAGGEERDIAEIRVYPHYALNSAFDNDIALLRLATPSAITPVRPARPADAARFAPGAPATVAGWGNRSSFANVYPLNAYKATKPIITDALCRATYGDDFIDGMICAGLPEGGVDACQGDSGGPLIVPDSAGQPLHVGVVSFGAGCALPDRYGVYTRTASYLDWVEAQIDPAPRPHLSVGVAGPRRAAPTDALTYTVVLANTGNQPLTQGQVQLTLPPGATHSASFDGGIFADGAVTWLILGTLLPGDTLFLRTELRATARLSVAAVEADAQSGGLPIGATLRGTSTTFIDEPYLVAGIAGPAVVPQGGVITQTLSVGNLGLGPNAAAADLLLRYAIPPGTSYVRGGTLVGGVVTWQAPALSPGQVLTRTVTIQIDRPVSFDPEGRPLITTGGFSVSADRGRGESGVFVYLNTWVLPQRLTLSLDGPARAGADEPVTYTLTLNNLTLFNLRDVVVQVELPDSVELVAGGGGALRDGVLTWRLPQALSSTTQILRFSVRSSRSFTIDAYRAAGATSDPDLELRAVGDTPVTTRVGAIYLPLVRQ